MKFLTVENLCIDFVSGREKLRAVSNVSFDVEQGSITALVGESGCGKSASCLSITRLLPSPPAVLSADRVGFLTKSGRETDLFQLSPRQLRRIRGSEIAYIFQEPGASLNPVMRIGDQIAEVLALCCPGVRDRKKRVIELLDNVGIPAPDQRIYAFPHELSGGMQQRVMIAMALMLGPDLIIADEPTTALDVTVQAQVLKLMRTLWQSNSAILLITHDLGVISQMATGIAVMKDGRVVEKSDDPNAFFADPVHPYSRTLVAEAKKMEFRQEN